MRFKALVFVRLRGSVSDAAMKEADLELISIFKLDELTDENE